MTLRDRQRVYYYDQLDRHFPGLRQSYQHRFGNRYACAANQTDQLWAIFEELCHQYGINTHVSRYTPPPRPKQLTLL